MNPRVYPDIFCKRCGKRTPAKSTAQKYCPECAAIVKTERERQWRRDNRAKIKGYKRTQSPELEKRDSIEGYVCSTNWSYVKNGKCERCRRQKPLNLFNRCRDCHSYVSTHEMSGPDDVYFSEEYNVSDLPLTPLGGTI